MAADNTADPKHHRPPRLHRFPPPNPTDEPTRTSHNSSVASSTTVLRASPNDTLANPRRNLPLRDRLRATTSLRLHDSLPSRAPAPATSAREAAGDSAGRRPAVPAAAYSPRYPRSRERSTVARPPNSQSVLSTTPATPTATATAHSRPGSAASNITTTSVSRTPSHRRPPAYLSSHGIETTYGPPPALITRSGATSDIVRRIQQQYRDALTQHVPGYFGFGETREGKARRSSVSITSTAENKPTYTALPRRTISLRARHWPVMSQDESSPGNVGGSNMSPERGTRTGSPVPRESTPDGQTNTTDGDLFLKLADSPRPQDVASDRTDRRRSRIARAAQRKSLPENIIPTSVGSQPALGMTPRTTDLADTPRTDPHQMRDNQNPTQSKGYSITQKDSTIQDSSPSILAFSSTARQTQMSRRQSQSSHTAHPSPGLRSPESNPYGRRRPSLGSGLLEPSKTYKPSKLYYTSSRDTDSIAQGETSLETPRLPKADGTTESVGSSHAPSTVWDELDELKSRIRKLELTGHMPATSGQAIQGASISNGPVSNSSNERPRTASTLPTTISSSPQAARKNSVSSPETTVGGPAAASLHPNLHSALAKCKSLLTPALHRALEATANDALALAAMTSTQPSQGTAYSSASTASSVTVVDRNVRRKADSMCRSLTDLCIALCDTKNESQSLNSPATVTALRRGSRDESVFSPGLTPTMRDVRGTSVDPEALSRNSPSRALSRIEARRTSLMNHGLQIQSSPIAPLSAREQREPRSPRSPTATFSDLKRSSSTRTADPVRFSDRMADRANTSLLRVRPRKTTMENDISADENDENERTLRAPSRAFTELSNIHQRRASAQQTHIPGPALPLPQRSHTQRISRDYTAPLSSPRDLESRLERSKERLPVESRLGLREREVREYSPASDQTRQLLRNLRNTSGYPGPTAERNGAPRMLRTDRDRTVRYMDGENRNLDRRPLTGDRGVRGSGIQ